jgi:hypothetical protein
MFTWEIREADIVQALEIEHTKFWENNLHNQLRPQTQPFP